jgi:hypothetical protein
MRKGVGMWRIFPLFSKTIQPCDLQRFGMAEAVAMGNAVQPEGHWRKEGFRAIDKPVIDCALVIWTSGRHYGASYRRYKGDEFGMVR